MLVVHIGLGKTATTTLQLRIFPKLAAMKKLCFNDPKLLGVIDKFIVSKNQKDLRKIKEELKKRKNVLISYESLVDWNPVGWRSAAELNLRMFGPGAIILLTLREPKDYLRSVYQQMIQEGQIIEPERFFINQQKNQNLKSDKRGKLTKFEISAFKLADLVKLYKKKFKKTVVVKMENLQSMNFLENLFLLSEQEKNILKKIFKDSKKVNQSFSNSAMKLTFLKEKTFQKYLQNPICLKIKIYLFKLVPLLQFMSWRWFMQKIVDRIIPYEKYCFPEQVFDQNPAFKKSVLFYKQLK